MPVTSSTQPWRVIGNLAHLALCATIFKISCSILPRCITVYYTIVAEFLLLVILAQFTFEFAKGFYFTKKINPDGKAVFITGCDSGFGHALAERLDSSGFHVFASCLNPSENGAVDLQKSCSSRLHVLQLDVTKEDSVTSALQYVKDNIGKLELWAVVNNAGIQKGFGVQMSSMKDFRDTMEVNTFGFIRVTKAFLPLLRKSKGRIINMNALLGRFAAPHVCPYVMSKFASVAFTECLRHEMKDWGVTVISVEPELFQTPISNIKNVTQRLLDTVADMDEDTKALYDKEYLRAFRSASRTILSTGSLKTEIVIDELESAICLENPDSLYKPRRNFLSFVLLQIAEYLPRNIMDFVVCTVTYLCGFPKPAKAPLHKYLLSRKNS